MATSAEINKVIDETQIDFGNAKIIETKFAPDFAGRLDEVYPYTQSVQTIMGIMNSYKSLAASTSVAGAIGTALGAVSGALNYLNGVIDQQVNSNINKWMAARKLTAQTYFSPGTWSRVVFANGPKPNDLDLYDNAGGWSESQFLAQYNPGIIWVSDRKAKSDIVLPTWETPPYTNGYGMVDVDKWIVFPQWAPLSGFTADHKWMYGQPAVAPIPADQADRFTGTLPVLSLSEIDSSGGFDGSKLMPQALKNLIAKLEEFQWKQAFAPPPDFYYLFSLGTYPFTSWSTSSNGRGAAGTGSVTLDANMAAIAAMIHSPTPYHAMIRELDVINCYQQWLRCTRIRQLPFLENKQPDDKIYLDNEYLPWSANPYAIIQCITPGKDTFQYDPKDENGVLWEEKCKLHPELADVVEVSNRCKPKGFIGSEYVIPWKTLRSVEQSFRSFFALRRACIYQMDKMKDNFREAAKKSPDPVLKAAALGEKIPYLPYSLEDPLKGISGPDEFFAKRKSGGKVIMPGPGGLKGTNNFPTGNSSGSGGLLLIGGAAAAAYYFLKKKRK